ncbi:MAG TPA: response regulator [Methanospirillum sp.]|uniref:response regulator n=1 Tax=Methanospirillum sp. TaxID=45200 RepID=UPI002BC99568|nr:response regulator [Methanospirillum sp.]HWQ64946.1 response regulator [Methanospirillum sp.]
MKRILVVDDDLGILDSTRQILEIDGYEVETASTGGEGLKKIESTFFNLALFDIKLPDMEGTELLEKSHKIRPTMKKIMVTGYASLENSVISLNAGADAYILKPVDPDMLLAKVKEKLVEQEREASVDGEKIAEFLEEKLLNIRR